MFELNNEQRKVFGLEPIMNNWDRVTLKGDQYRPDSVLYYDGDTIRRQIISTPTKYHEIQYCERTRNREFLLPKTDRGKPKKLSSSSLESRTPIGIYLLINSSGDLIIASHTTQTAFYSRLWEHERSESNITELIKEFIQNSPDNHIEDIEAFRNAKRKNVKYKAGDFITFKLNRTEFGFGRILLDINKARKKKFIDENHCFRYLMGPPVLIKFYAYKSRQKKVDLNLIKAQPSLPSDYIMDNRIFYGEYEIIGNLPLEIDEFDFPISYGRKLSTPSISFLQWGLIQNELPISVYGKHLNVEEEMLRNNNSSKPIHNPYGYYSIGFEPHYDKHEIINTINNGGTFDFNKVKNTKQEWDLRNPKNIHIKTDIMKAFGLDPTKGYEENARHTNNQDVLDLIKKMQ